MVKCCHQQRRSSFNFEKQRSDTSITLLYRMWHTLLVPYSFATIQKITCVSVCCKPHRINACRHLFIGLGITPEIQTTVVNSLPSSTIWLQRPLLVVISGDLIFLSYNPFPRLHSFWFWLAVKLSSLSKSELQSGCLATVLVIHIPSYITKYFVNPVYSLHRRFD